MPVAFEDWFGHSRNQVRDRAIMLVENGHVNVASMRVIRVKKKIQSGNEPEYVNLIEAKVVASQKAKWYLCRVALSEDWTTLLGRPYQSCECVVRCGPTDSHQLAVFLMTLTVRVIMRRVEDKSWGVLRNEAPPPVHCCNAEDPDDCPLCVRSGQPGPLPRRKYRSLESTVETGAATSDHTLGDHTLGDHARDLPLGDHARRGLPLGDTCKQEEA